MNHSEALELGEPLYLAGVLWGRWLGAVEGAAGDTSQGTTYLWTQVLEKLLVMRRSGRRHGGMEDLWYELAHACVVREANHGVLGCRRRKLCISLTLFPRE